MRLLHRILPTGRYLFLRKIIDSPLCSFCKQEEETITHLFWGCTVIQSFWSNLQTLIKETCINRMHFKLSEALVLFGVTDNTITDKVIDFFILLAKFYFYRCRWGENAPNLNVFLRILKDWYLVERYLHIVTNRSSDFDIDWLPYKALIL